MTLPLEELLVVQEHDTAIDRLRHRRATLPARAELSSREGDAAAIDEPLATLRARRDTLMSEEQRLEADADGFASKAVAVERQMYSGEISSPRELQAMAADVESLRRHRSTLEDRALALLEEREPLDVQAASLEDRLATVRAEADAARSVLGAQEADVDRELDGILTERAALADKIPPDLLATYERCRLKANGVGAARLSRLSCGGCHLTIPAVEADRIRKLGSSVVAFCDNCGCILVP